MRGQSSRILMSAPQAAPRSVVVAIFGPSASGQTALAELDVPPAPSAEQRSHWERVYDRLGAERAHAELAARDAEAAERLHPNDRRRVVRALELAALGSRLPSAERLWTEETRHSTIVFGLDLSREALAERIEA